LRRNVCSTAALELVSRLTEFRFVLSLRDPNHAIPTTQNAPPGQAARGVLQSIKLLLNATTYAAKRMLGEPTTPLFSITVFSSLEFT
jgi:hypothetical protein